MTIDPQRTPSHIQITPLEGDKWGWVVWFGRDGDPRDRDGEAPSFEAALAAVQEACTVAH